MVKISEFDKIYFKLKTQIAILKDVAMHYQGKTIENIIQQIEARMKEMKDYIDRDKP